MSEERVLEEPEQAISRIDGHVKDLESTVLARLAAAVAEARRRPVGTFEWTLATVAPAGTVLLQGQTLQRSTYPALYDYVVAADPGGFSTTSTTIVLPDLRGRVLRGVASGEAAGQQVGADSRALTTAQMPAHDHNVSVANHAGHFHEINSSTESAGSHGGHVDPGNVNHGTGAGAAHGHPPAWGLNGGTHSHAIQTDTGTVGLSAHQVSESTIGSGSAVDLRQASVAVNYLIWT